MKISKLITLLFASLLAFINHNAKAQSYPSKLITIVVPLAPGTAMDLLTRFYASELQKSLGQTVIVSNQPGAGLMLAASVVAKAEADGYTLLVNSAPVMAVNQTLYKKINYDPEADFVPISLYAKSPFLLIVNPSLGITTTKAFIDKAIASDSPMNYASSGVGTLQFLAMERLKQDFKFKLNHVPYRASPQILSDLLGGHVMSSVYEAGAAIEQVREGKLLALATTSSTRHASLPNVPTLSEAVGVANYEAVSWHVLLAPSATPAPVVAKLTEEMKRISETEAFKKKVLELGLEPQMPRTFEQTKAYITSERERWGGIVKSLGLEGSQ